MTDLVAQSLSVENDDQEHQAHFLVMNAEKMYEKYAMDCMSVIANQPTRLALARSLKAKWFGAIAVKGEEQRNNIHSRFQWDRPFLQNVYCDARRAVAAIRAGYSLLTVTNPVTLHVAMKRASLN